MEEDSWDAEDFDVDKGFAGDNVWEGEDKELDLAAVIEPDPVPVKQPDKPAKTKEERIAEKKAKRRAAEAPPPKEELNTEEEKRRREELQRNSDLQVAMETFGISKAGSIDAMQPSTEEDFSKFGETLADKIRQYETSPQYVKFIEQLVIKCCGGFDTEDLRHLSTVLSTMATEKQKLKNPKTSKKKGGKLSLGARAVGKASKKLGGDLDYENEFGAEFDDFM